MDMIDNMTEDTVSGREVTYNRMDITDGTYVCMARCTKSARNEYNAWMKQHPGYQVRKIFYIDHHVEGWCREFRVPMFYFDDKVPCWRWTDKRVEESEQPRIVLYGRFAAFKGHADLVRTMRRTHPNYTIHHFGSQGPSWNDEGKMTVGALSLRGLFEEHPDPSSPVDPYMRDHWVDHGPYQKSSNPLRSGDIVLFPYLPGICEHSLEYALLECLDMNVRIVVRKGWVARLDQSLRPMFVNTCKDDLSDLDQAIESSWISYDYKECWKRYLSKHSKEGLPLTLQLGGRLWGELPK